MDNMIVYLLLLQVVSGDCVKPKEYLWSQLPAIEALCPGQYVCSEDRPLNVSEVGPTSDTEGCCTECSCDPSCSSLGNCCFQRMDTTRDRSDQECLYETFFPPTRAGLPIKSYYMVAKEPHFGCVENFQINSASSEPCCEAKIAPWGSFLPVWSPSKARIYKNRLYAECHGVHDFILWDVSHICSEVKELGSDLTGCNIHFTFPGRKQEIQTEQCFRDLYDTCPDDFVVMPGVQNLTTQEVLEGCNSDFRSAYDHTDHLKNVYCYICIKDPYFMPLRYCSSQGSNRSPHKNTLISLLSREYLTEYRPHQNNVPDKACEVAEGRVLDDTCRPAHCPTGRTFSAAEGSCTFASQSWNIGKLYVSFLLTLDNPNESLTYDAVRDLVKSGLRIIFPKKWVIAYAFIPLFDSVSLTDDWKDQLMKTIHPNTLERPAKELLLVVYPKDSTGDPAKLMENIQSNLLEKWTVICGDIRMKASARLSNVTIDIHGTADVWTIFVQSSMRATDNNGRMLFNESNAFLMIVLPTTMKKNVDFISKLFFCRQVELQSYEFVLNSDATPLALLLVKDNKYFGRNEFRIRKTGGNHTARMCLEDAGYQLYHQTATARRLKAYVDFAGMVILAMSIGYFIVQ